MLQQFQALQQQYQSVIFQKEAAGMQMQEAEIAEKELSRASGDAFKAVGAILVKKDARALLAEIAEQKEMLDVRIKSLEKQEKLITDRLADLQKRIIRMQPDERIAAGAGAK